jgi:hypothetical protein
MDRKKLQGADPLPAPPFHPPAILFSKYFDYHQCTTLCDILHLNYDCSEYPNRVIQIPRKLLRQKQ